MSDAAEIEPIFYEGEHRHGLDAKHRVAVPSAYRPKGQAEFTLLVWSDGLPNDTRLMVLPPARMKALRTELSKKPLSDPAATKLRRFLVVSSATVTTDTAGRILIPEKFIEQAGITSEVVFSGLSDVFEIWAPERYDAIMGTISEADKKEARGMI